MSRPQLASLCALLVCLALPSLVTAQQKTVKPTVAVLYFDYSGTNKDMEVLKKGLTQMLITDLQPLERVTLVERERLEEVLKELDLARSARVDKRTTAKLGKLLGARYLIVGGYFDFGTTLRVDTRVIDVQTGKYVGTAAASAPNTDLMVIERKIVEELTKILNTALKTTALRPKAQKVAAAPTRKTPKKLTRNTALRYARALDAKDKGDVESAARELKAVLTEQPDFELAADDLAAMMK